MITLIIILYTAVLKAPSYPTMVIPRAEGINIYEPLIKAIVSVESSNGKYLYNEKERAIGWFQIRECRIEDFNRRTGKNYSHIEMYDYDKSREVFLYYCQGRSYEKVAKSWNGSGKKTVVYWSKVKKAII